MRKIKFISILLVLSMLLTVPAFAFSLDFTDVPEKAVYAESVSYLAETAVPSEWEMMKRYLGWMVFTIMVLVIYIVGLRA